MTCMHLQYTFLPRCMESTRSSDENSVCLSICKSVCPSVTRVNCDKTVEIYVQIFIPYDRSFSLVFSERELMFMFAICRRPSVVCLSVCLSVCRLSSVVCLSVCNVRAPYSAD